ncbi:glycosyltransferase family 4 protein [Williamsia sp. 1135]|uniref:glycosyltransferase family 4 protein n=1 Tax=Williamsia sp. 1135 TaxID=1889262 RepID=UPI000A119126|nr:glycosyltransferase family 4 protein [Williamsia sp. 1135]ORM33659.1 alpha-(1-2)-phosphatidylinositol mannosyltransferase [Williamsia sp. 1135]
MHRTLLVTNDFPPRQGGIQSYLQNLVDRLPADEIIVYAPRWRGDSHVRFDKEQPYEVVRHPTTLMLPTPIVAHRAAELVRAHQVDTVWFGAAAPLATLAGTVRRAGASRVVASTHGHEVGWSMLPLARQTLGTIGRGTDVITYVSTYTRGRFATAFGPRAALEHLPPGVDVDRFKPDPVARQHFRERHGLGEAPTILCLSRLVPRKGQDMLIRALPEVRAQIDGAVLVIVGGGPDQRRLRELAAAAGVADHVVFTGSVPADELAGYHNIADVFAMPARTRGRGLDVEGLGIVYLEASSTGIPVIAGDSGGAPETVRPGETGLVVDGRSLPGLVEALTTILCNRELAESMGRAGREWVQSRWRWEHMSSRLAQLL